MLRLKLQAFACAPQRGSTVPRSVQLTARKMGSITRISRDDRETFLGPVSPLAGAWRLDRPAIRRGVKAAVRYLAPASGQPGDHRDMLRITLPAHGQPHTRQPTRARAGHHAAAAIVWPTAYATTIYRPRGCLRAPRPHLTLLCNMNGRSPGIRFACALAGIQGRPEREPGRRLGSTPAPRRPWANRGDESARLRQDEELSAERPHNRRP